MSINLFEREEIQNEKRFWLRTTRRCNNHCIFCHDSEIQNGELIETDILRQEIRNARQNGYSRLILSGGEPTIHPDIINLIDYARRIGFDWIQIISNGRMFAYPDFTRKAIAAGLNEVTISFHSHIEGVSDRITGVKGSYMQTIRGIENLKRYNIVISIDIVINRLNFRHLREAIEYFYKRFGISEFDLLHLTPFGRALINYDELRISEEEERWAIKKAIKYAEEQNIVVWTNRVLPQILERNEKYIQDPHKILDEIYGRSEIFEKYLSSGILECRNSRRCADCFVREFCDFLIDLRSRYLKRRVERIEIKEPIEEDLIEEIFDHLMYNATIMTTPKIARSLYNEIENSHKRLILKVRGGEDIQAVVKELKPVELISDSIEITRIKGIKKTLILNNENISYIVNDRNLSLFFPNSSSLKEEFEVIPDIKAIKEVIKKTDLKISNLPRCITKEHYRDNPYFFKAEFITKEGFELNTISSDFLLNRNYYKSLRCKNCKFSTQCKGIHINHIRRFGFRILKPVKL